MNIFWMEYTGKVQSPQLFSQLFFPTKPQSTFHFLKHRIKSLSMIIYFNDSIFRSTNKSYFLFFLIPTPYSIWLQNLWSREKKDSIVNKSTLAFHLQFTWTCTKGGCMMHSQIFIKPGGKMLPINTYTKITARKNTNIALYGSSQLNLEMFLFQFIN